MEVIYLGKENVAQTTARAEEGSGEESARASAFLFLLATAKKEPLDFLLFQLF